MEVEAEVALILVSADSRRDIPPIMTGPPYEQGRLGPKRRSWSDLTIRAAAAPRITLVLVLWALTAGALVLFPSLIYLLRVFKREPARS